MRKQNTYKARTVILFLLLLGQELLAHAGDNANKKAQAIAEIGTKNLEDINATEATQPDVQVKPLENQEEVVNKPTDKVSDKPSGNVKEKAVNYFDILEFQVEGNTKLANDKIEMAVYPHMGEKKTIEDVEKARENLEKAYHQAGYLTVIVDIPEQEVNRKIVKLNVTEGKVSKLRIKDSHYYSLGRIKELSPSVSEGEVPHFPTLQQDVTRLNRTADRRVTPVLKAGREFGTVDVELKVDDKLPLHASLELNDRFSQDTTRWRLGGSVRYDNLWQLDHSLSLGFQVSPQDINEVQVYSGNYLMRFDESDILLALYGVHSKSNVATVGGINILGNATILGARLIKPLPAVDNYFHSVSLGVDYKDFGQTVEFGENINTPIKYLALSASYSGNWQGEGSSTQFTTSSNFGLRGLVSDECEFDAKRPGKNGLSDKCLGVITTINKPAGAKPNFFIARAEVERTQALPKGLEGYIKLDGFYSGSPLISNEQYLAGGADTVRGYLEAELSSDKAVHSTIEIRSPQLFKNSVWLKDFKLAAFYDYASLYTIDADSATISGAGIGMRLKALKGFNLNLDLAVPLKDALETEKGDFRSHMRFWYEF